MGTLKLESVEELLENYLNLDSIEYSPYELKRDILIMLRGCQRNAVEFTLQQASENAIVDYNYIGDHSYPAPDKEDIEVYIINSSILNLKETIFKNNQL